MASQTFKAVIRLFINQCRLLNNKDAIRTLQKDVTVELLYSDDIIQSLNTLFRVRRDNLVLNSFKYQQHPKSSKQTCGVAICFIASQEDSDFAFERYSSLHASVASALTVKQGDFPTAANSV